MKASLKKHETKFKLKHNDFDRNNVNVYITLDIPNLLFVCFFKLRKAC